MTDTYDLVETSPPRTGTAGKFPAQRYERAAAYGAEYFEQVSLAARSIDPLTIERAATVLLEAYLCGAKVFSCGNGGSASIANHLQCDHMKGVQTGTDLRPQVVSLSTNVELITAIANDIGYEDIFTYQLQSQAKPGDVLVAISSSGRSPNIVRAIDWASANGVRTIALTGFDGGDARLRAGIPIHASSTNYGVIEDVHQSVMHALAQYVRHARMTPGTVAITTF